MMRNIPKYYTTKKLLTEQVLKFDIIRPDPDRQLWNRKRQNYESETQECIIGTAQEIQARESKTTSQGNLKRTIQHEQTRKTTMEALAKSERCDIRSLKDAENQELIENHRI